MEILSGREIRACSARRPRTHSCAGRLAARSGAGIRAAPAITRPNAIIRPVIPTAPAPIESRKTRMPPRIAVRLAATAVSAMTSTPGVDTRDPQRLR
jgi:hypothetical protein